MLFTKKKETISSMHGICYLIESVEFASKLLAIVIEDNAQIDIKSKDWGIISSESTDV